MKRILFQNALVILCAIALSTNLVHAGDVYGKLTVGYQGWFTCENDNSPINAGDKDDWVHWGQGADKPVPGKVGFELYPDMREYTKTYATGLANLGNGSDSRLFSSYDQQVVNTHFRWMSEYGIDCAALQRFGHAIGNSSKMKHKDGIARMVKNAAEQYNQKFYIMYDISNWDDFRSEMKSDWNNTIVGNLKLTSSSAYAREGGKPVVCIWGIGSNGRPGSESSWKEVIKFFKDKGCFVIAGVVKDWRTSNSAARNAAATAHMIHPWHVGVYSSSSVDGYFNGRIKDDMKWCKDRGIKYMPTMWPGFSWANWKEGPRNKTPRKHGDYMWKQFYKAKQKFKEVGMTGSAYVAMFDEFDEATAICKAAEDKSMRPTNQWFLTLDADGIKCSSDFYLRLTRDGAKMIKGQIGLTSSHPTKHYSTTTTKTNNASYVSQTVPSSLSPGQSATVSVTMKNTGTTTWTAGGNYKLGCDDKLPNEDFLWGIPRAYLSSTESIKPNESKTFSYTITAPSTPGTYNFQWGMVQDGVEWFGSKSSNRQIKVDGEPVSLPYTASNKSISYETFNWSSGPIDISSVSSAKISMNIEGSTPTTMEPDDYLNIYYRLNGGTQVALSTNSDGFAKKPVSKSVSGNTVEIIIQAKNSMNDEIYNVTDIRVEKEGIVVPTYFLLVTEGGFDGDYAAGATVNINANTAPVNQVFDKWVVVSGGPISIANVNAATTTLTMPANDAEVKATYKPDGPGTCDLPYTASNKSVSKGAINWSSGAIDISCVESVTISMDIEGSTAATMEANDYIEVLYIVDGVEKVLAFETDGFAKKTVSATVSGNSVELSIESINSASDETHSVSNIRVAEGGGNNCDDDLPYSASNKTMTKGALNWSSGPIKISCASSAKISMDIEGLNSSTMESADYLNVYYKLDGAARQSISKNTDGFAKKTIFATVSGSTVEIIIEGLNSASDETHNVSNIRVVSLGDKAAEADELSLGTSNSLSLNCYPNPFSKYTSINYMLEADSDVSIDVYNIYGQKVSALLTNQRQGAGIQSIVWNPSETGNLANGIYIYVINGSNEIGSFTKSQKINYIK